MFPCALLFTGLQQPSDEHEQAAQGEKCRDQGSGDEMQQFVRADASDPPHEGFQNLFNDFHLGRYLIRQ